MGGLEARFRPKPRMPPPAIPPPRPSPQGGGRAKPSTLAPCRRAATPTGAGHRTWPAPCPRRPPTAPPLPPVGRGWGWGAWRRASGTDPARPSRRSPHPDPPHEGEGGRSRRRWRPAAGWPPPSLQARGGGRASPAIRPRRQPTAPPLPPVGRGRGWGGRRPPSGTSPGRRRFRGAGGLVRSRPGRRPNPCGPCRRPTLRLATGRAPHPVGWPRRL